MFGRLLNRFRSPFQDQEIGDSQTVATANSNSSDLDSGEEDLSGDHSTSTPTITRRTSLASSLATVSLRNRYAHLSKIYMDISLLYMGLRLRLLAWLKLILKLWQQYYLVTYNCAKREIAIEDIPHFETATPSCHWTRMFPSWLWLPQTRQWVALP